MQLTYLIEHTGYGLKGFKIEDIEDALSVSTVVRVGSLKFWENMCLEYLELCQQKMRKQ